MKDELIQQLKKYEDKWVALLGPEHDMKIVASGNDAFEAVQEATKAGFGETALLKVRRSDVAYIMRA